MEEIEGYKVTQVTREDFILGVKSTYCIEKIGKYANLDEALKAKADEARAILKHIKLP